MRLPRTAAAILLLSSLASAGPRKTERSRHGMVAASTPYATEAGVRILTEGGNAVDAAVAACFALMVTDPPMTSLGGRSQTVIALRDGRVVGIDGATQAPAGVPPLGANEPPRSGHQVAPVPGNPAALAQALAQYGRLPLARVMQPAIELAESGFAVTPAIASIWESEQKRLQASAGAAANYLKPDGSAYRAGEIFRHPRLARLLRRIAESGPDTVYRGETAARIDQDVRRGGGFLTVRDLESYRPEPGVVVRSVYRGHEVASMGKQAWGNTLAEMLHILGEFRLGKGAPRPEEVEILARTIRQALEDRPQQLGSLRPKPDGYPLELISSPRFGRERAARIRGQLGTPLAMTVAEPGRPDHDTTHLSVMDAEGNAVAMTTSIGPRFGSGVATPELGFLYAHSYNMRSNPVSGARDLTEMTPTIVLRNGRPVLAIGAAGSERIPGAILQVISFVLDRGYSLEQAVQAPRVFCAGNRARLDEKFAPEVAERLRELGFAIEIRDPGIHQHLGIVHAVQYDPRRKEFTGAADPVYDGAAGGPSKRPRGRQGVGLR